MPLTFINVNAIVNCFRWNLRGILAYDSVDIIIPCLVWLIFKIYIYIFFKFFMFYKINNVKIVKVEIWYVIVAGYRHSGCSRVLIGELDLKFIRAHYANWSISTQSSVRLKQTKLTGIRTHQEGTQSIWCDGVGE